LILRKNAADGQERRKIKSSIQNMNDNDNKRENESFKIDEKDIKIISSLLSGYDNQQISSEFKIPLSTIQRRARIILQSGLLKHYFRPDYRRLGLKKGMIHVYLRDGDMKFTAEKISGMEGVTSVSIHIGNSDIVADFVYRDSEQIIDIVSSIKRLAGVENTVWSEEVYVLPINHKSLALPFHRLIKGGV
jgi:DNA-binding Lrp family transcriptional regulator